MQATNASHDGGGEWNQVGKKGKSSSGPSIQHGADSQTSNKKAMKNSLKNSKTLSLQAFYHGLPDDSVLEQAEGENMAISVERGIALIGGSTDYGLTSEEIVFRESLLSYFVDLIRMLGPQRLDGPELRCHLRDRIEGSDSLLVGRGAEGLVQTDNFATFLARSPDLIWVEDFVCAKIDKEKAKHMALTESITYKKHVGTLTASSKITTDSPSINILPTPAINPYGAIGPASPAAMSSLPASNLWKSGPPSIMGRGSAGVLPNVNNNRIPYVLVLGNMNSLYERAVRATEQKKSPGQISSGHPVFPVTLSNLTSPQPSLPSPSKINHAIAPMSAAVGSNRPVATATAMNNNASGVTYKTAVGIGSLDSSRSAGVPAATVESLNIRMQGLSLCNADLLRQLVDKEKQLQRLIKTSNTQDTELDAARLKIENLKEQQGNASVSVKTDESENPSLTESMLRTGSKNNNDATTSSKESYLIISLQKQLESEKLNARNYKQQLELERVYSTRISNNQKIWYNKTNPTTSIYHQV